MFSMKTFPLPSMNQMVLLLVGFIDGLVQMRSADIEQQLHMIVIQRIQDGFSRTAGFDKMNLPEMFKMMRNSRLCHVHDFREIADTQIGKQQRVDDFQSRRIGETLEYFRHPRQRQII